MSRSAIPAGYRLREIDDHARTGRYELVFSGAYFAIVRWVDGGWSFPNAAALDFEPTRYRVSDNG